MMSNMATSAEGELLEEPEKSISITVCFPTLQSNKKYEEKKLFEISSTFCALINSDGGLVTFSLKDGQINDAKDLERRIYQKFAAVLGQAYVRDAINRESLCATNMVFKVEGMSQLCTLQYNIYIPMKLNVFPLESANAVNAILQPDRIIELDNLIKAKNYKKDLVSGKPISDDSLNLEDRTVQYKLLKSGKGGHTSLGDRMISKENKFANYVSAFANYRGGHVYFGVDDDGVVWGQVVDDKLKIKNKIRKAINKVIWPSDDVEFRPTKGEHWEIFFEPVKDENGQIINNTFVIVVYISYCSGGVFTAEPESYYKVDGKVVKMPVQEWKKRVIQTASQIYTIARSNFSNTKAQHTYYTVMEKMMDFRNQGDTKTFETYIKYVKQQFGTMNVHLSTLSQEATYAFRSGEFAKAEKLIETYDSLQPQCEENMLIPGSMALYIKSANKRAQKDYKESYDLAKYGLAMADRVVPGLIQAWFCTHTALLANILANKETEAERRQRLIMEAKSLLGKALAYSHHVKSSNQFMKAVLDLLQKIYIHLSELHLGLSLSGSLASLEYVSVEDIVYAKTCLSMIPKLEDEGLELSPSRKVQYLLAHSALSFRQFQLGIMNSDSMEVDYLQKSLDECEEALNLATENKFTEMIAYCEELKCSLHD